MKKFIIIAIATIGIIVAVYFYVRQPARAADAFTINGTVTGFPDSTKLFLEDATPGIKEHIIDSCQVAGGKFTLKGKLTGKTLNVMLTTKSNDDYKFLWLQGTDMTFTAAKGKFHDAVITGSEVQNDEDKLEIGIKPINKATDSLNEIAKTDSIGLYKAVITKQFNALRKKEIEVTASFVQQNPASIVSAEVLNTYASSLGKARTAPLYNNLAPEVKTSVYGKNIAEYLALNKDLKVGDHYVDIIQPAVNGKSIKLSNYAGKVVLLDFWASWCGPCRGENPELVATYRQYNGKGFDILGVSLDSERKDWLDAISQDGLEWTNVSELRGDRCAPALIYGVSGIPDNYLIGKDGIILAHNLHGQDLRDKLAEVLKQAN